MLKHHNGVGYFQVCLVALLLAGLALCLPASAQTFRGSIIGTVSDSSGAAIAQATVIAKNIRTGLTRTTQTSSDGTYSLPELTVGTYEVSATKSGFQTAVATGVSVEIARDRHVDFTLKPGNVSQRVEVTEEAGVPIETTNNNLGGSFEGKDLVDLPINGRDIDKLYIMTPGVTGDPSGAAGSPASYGQFSANGNRDRANNFLLDGTDMNDSYRNLPAINQGGVFAVPSNTLPIESISELRVLTNFDAEYGRSSGSVINIVTKSGTNQVHGSVFEYFRNAVLNARNFFDTTGPKDAFKNNQFGGALGGPIKKNKTFFYAAYEGQREGLGLTSLNTVPTLNNSITGSPNNDYTQAIMALGGTTPCTTTIIACINAPGNAGVINPVIAKFYNFCDMNGGCSGGKSPWPAANLVTPVGPFNNVSSDASSNNVNSVIGKIDHSFNSSNTLSARYFYGRSTQSFPLGTGGGNNIPNTNTVAPTNTNLLSVSLVSAVSSHQVNEGRFGFNRFREGFFPEDAGLFGNPNNSINLNTCLGLVTGNNVATCNAASLASANPVDFGLPQMTFGSCTTPILSCLGSSRYSNPRNRIDRNYQFVDNFSWKFAKNEVKFGGEIRHTSVDSLEDLNFRGRLEFNGLADFLDGDVLGGTINYGTTQRYTHQDSLGLFIQDAWQILPHLTLNAGIRWDYYGVIREGSDAISNYNPGVGLVPMNQPYKPDWNNFAPRVSLAWDPFGKGKTVIRAGAAVFYDTFSFDFFDGQIFEPTNNLGPAYNAIPGHPIYQGYAVGGLLAPNAPVFDTATSASCSPFVASISCDTTDASTVGHLVTPYVTTFTLNVQQELTKNTVLQVGYVGTQGRKLQRLIDQGQPSQAAITANDVTCADETLGVVNPPPGTTVGMCNFGTFVPRNFNNYGITAFPALPGQNNFAAVMSTLAPQTPLYLEQLQTSAQSAYNSLQVSLTQRNWHGFTQQINYTFSRSIDDASDGQDFVPHTAQPNDSTNPSVSNKGLSNFDTRHHFVWALTYAFPKANSMGRFGEGWSVSSVVTIVSGHPWELVDSNDDYDGSYEFFGRADLVGPLHYNFSNPAKFLDVSAFAVPCTLDGTGGTGASDCLVGTRHFGTEGRNVLLGPAFRQWDFSIVKNTRITERYSLQFRADAFNLLNHPNFANPLEPSAFADLAPYTVCGVVNVPAGCPTASRFAPGPTQFFPIAATADTGIGNPILGGGGPRSFQFAMKLIF